MLNTKSLNPSLSENCRRLSKWLILLVSLGLGLSIATTTPSPVMAKSDTLPTWHDTGLKYPQRVYDACFDPSRPATLYISTLTDLAFSAGTQAYNLAEGTQTLVSNYIFNTCDKYNGFLYHTDGIRFDKNEPQGRFIKHTPGFFATDGSLQMYSLDNNKIFATGDGGISWEERTPPVIFENGVINSMAISGLDPKVIYALIASPVSPSLKKGSYMVLKSVDKGINWAKLYLGQANNPSRYFMFINAIDSFNKPDFLTLSIDNVQLISVDGGQTFLPFDDGTKYRYVEIFQTSQGILSLSTGETDAQNLTLSTDGGKTFSEKQNLPFLTGTHGFGNLIQLNGAPDTFLFYNNIGGNDFVWYSNDGAKSWQKLGTGLSNRVFVSPYLPTTVYTEDTKTGSIYALDLPDPGFNQTKGVSNNQAPGGLFFPQTQHNLFGVFKKYWESHGGMAKFGLPRTEPVREVNKSDGKVYLVQYFERARMEYHPELAGTDNEIELGLLGSEQTIGRSSQLAFKPVTTSVSTKSRYFFPQTAHSLSFGFLTFWLQQGGLSQFGYPISEEFEERSPDNGKLHTVQYFERGRFEYYPELAGTGFEVQLGLLGNNLLKQKGWL